MDELKPCPWCYSHGKKLKKRDVEWSVVDDNFGQFVHLNMIHYCPFCGRYLDDTN